MKAVLTALFAGVMLIAVLFLSALPYAVVLALAIAIVRCTGVI